MNLVAKEYKQLLRVQRNFTFRNDLQSISKALQWSRNFVRSNLEDPKLACRIKELSSALRSNVVQLEATGNNKFRLNLHNQVEYGPIDPKDLRMGMKGCCQEEKYTKCE